MEMILNEIRKNVPLIRRHQTLAQLRFQKNQMVIAIQAGNSWTKQKCVPKK
jgi:hypothetical protein